MSLENLPKNAKLIKFSKNLWKKLIFLRDFREIWKVQNKSETNPKQLKIDHLIKVMETQISFFFVLIEFLRDARNSAKQFSVTKRSNNLDIFNLCLLEATVQSIQKLNSKGEGTSQGYFVQYYTSNLNLKRYFSANFFLVGPILNNTAQKFYYWIF